jgi:outer membrane protein OmpA-like peptidoglycan-associated protein
MNRYAFMSVSLSLFLSLALSACAPLPRQENGNHAGTETKQQRLEALKSKIDASGGDDFGVFLLEAHRAGKQLDSAYQIYHSLNSSSATSTTPQFQQGEIAADTALLYRNKAQEAFIRLLSVLDDTEMATDLEERLAYLESLHILPGEEFEPVTLYFGSGSAHLNRTEQEKIATLVKNLHAYPIFALRLIGYTDTVGTKTHNLNLAQQRTHSVIRALHRQGLSMSTVISLALGQVAGPLGIADAQARRVEIIPYIHGRDPLLAEALAQIEDAKREQEIQRQARQDGGDMYYEVDIDEEDLEEDVTPHLAKRRGGR